MNVPMQTVMVLNVGVCVRTLMDYNIISCIPEHWWVVGFIEGLKQGISSMAHKLAGLKIFGHQ